MEILQQDAAQVKSRTLAHSSLNGHSNGHANGTQPPAPPIPLYSVGEYSTIHCLLARPKTARHILKRLDKRDFAPSLALIIEAGQRELSANMEPDFSWFEEGLRCLYDAATGDAQRADLREAMRVVDELQFKDCSDEIAARAFDFIKAKELEFKESIKTEEEYVFEFSTDSDLDSRLSGITWLWNDYIPNGFVTSIVGEQDQGKSMVMQGLCDTILRGRNWPDGSPAEFPPDTKLLWIDTEGSLALFHQRAKDWGMPRGRFILPPDPLQELTIDDDACWQWIEAAIERFHPPLVGIDALSGAHRSGKESGNDEMKPIMKKLASLAQKFNIAVVVIHHLNKPAPGVPSYPITIHRLRGATAIPQYCRSILAVGTPDPARPESRRLDVIKLNLARKPDPVGYELTDFGPSWGIAPEPPKEHRAIDDAIDFLEVALANGPRPSDEIEEERKAASIGSNAIKDAKKALGVRAKREGGKDGGKWFLVPKSFTGKISEEEAG